MYYRMCPDIRLFGALIHNQTKTNHEDREDHEDNEDFIINFVIFAIFAVIPSFVVKSLSRLYPRRKSARIYAA